MFGKSTALQQSERIAHISAAIILRFVQWLHEEAIYIFRLGLGGQRVTDGLLNFYLVTYLNFD